MYCKCKNVDLKDVHKYSDEHTIAYMHTKCGKEIEKRPEALTPKAEKEPESEFCTCDRPKIEEITETEQYGGNIREYVVGYYCTICNKDVKKEVPDYDPDEVFED